MGIVGLYSTGYGEILEVDESLVAQYVALGWLPITGGGGGGGVTDSAVAQQVTSGAQTKGALDAAYAATLLTAATATSAASLVADKHTPVDATSGALTMTLPTPTRVGQQIRVEKVDSSANAVTVSGTLRGNAGAVVMPFQYEVRTFIAESLSSWRVASGNTPKTALDATYARIAPAPTGVAAADTAALTALANSVAAAVATNSFGVTGGTIRLQAGTYLTNAPLPLLPGLVWQGAGRAATLIRLADGANCDVFANPDFTALTGTGANNNSGAGRWAMRDLTIDGNRTAQTATSFGLRVYGFDFDVERVTIRSARDDGMWTEWGYLGIAIDGMEARFSGVKIHDCGGWGWHNRGPHDSMADSMIVYENNKRGINAGGIWVENDTATPQKFLAGALQLSNSHIWGEPHTWGLIADGSVIASNCQVEGALVGQILARAPLSFRGKVFNLAPYAAVPNIGIQLGDDGTTPGVPTSFSRAIGDCDIDCRVQYFYGSSRTSAPLAWVNAFSSSVRVSMLMSTPPLDKAITTAAGAAINTLTTLDLANTTGMPVIGRVTVPTSGGTATLAYTGISGATLTGISVTTGTGTWTLSAGNATLVTQSIWGTVDGQSHLRVQATHPSATVAQRAAWSFGYEIGTHRWYGQGSGPTVEIDAGAGHLRTPNTALVPTIALNGGALGTTVPTPTISGTDTRGQVGLGTGTGTTTGTAVTVTLANAHPARNPVVVVTPANAAAAALQPYATATGLGRFNIGFGVAPAASQGAGTYFLNYMVIG